MTYPLTISASAMREINRSAVIEIIRREGPISRTAIAERLDVSLPTVMRVVEDLAREGFVRQHGTKEWSGGRRRPLLEINVDGDVVLGVDLGGTEMYGAISDLGGNVLDEARLGRRGSSGEESFNCLASLIEKLLASAKLKRRNIRGIGVGAPGITAHNEGIVTWSFALNWKDFPLKERLAKRYKLPVIVDNDVNLAALGELWFGAGQNTRNMILIAAGTGVGAGIILEGALYRGANEASGEIGYMITGREFFGKNHIDFGALESVASSAGIVERAKRHLSAQDQNAGSAADLLSEDVFTAARKGEAWAWKTINETVDYLAIAVANLTVTFDPELIVLGGGIAHSADLLARPILERIEGMIPSPPKLIVSTLGQRATVMGAIANVLHNTSNFYVVHKLS